jgi:hypothetical protein
MRAALRILSLVAILALLVPNLTAQQKEKDKPAGENKENLARLPQLKGTLSNPGSDKGHLTVRVPVPYLERSGRGVTAKETTKDVEIAQAEDIKVRTINPPPVYDEKGKPRRHTPKELKELKGEGNLPGYTADLNALKANQTVIVYYSPPKKKASGKKGEDLDKDALEDSKPRARMVVILAEPKN